MKNAFESLESRRLMANFVVTNSNDTGAGSLRDAITQANATTAADVINFNLPSNALVINLASQLPQVTQPLTIDGATQPGYSGTPRVMLRGSTAPASTNGLQIGADNVTLRGLSIGNFPSLGQLGGRGIDCILGASTLRVESCYIGISPDGTTAAPNYRGIVSTGSNTVVVDSVVSGNLNAGIWLSGGFGQVDRCIVGLRPDGQTVMANGGTGVTMDAGAFYLVNQSVIAANGAGGVLVTGSAINATITDSIINMSADRALRRSGTGHSVHFLGTSGQIANSKVAGGSFGMSAVRIENTSGITVNNNDIGLGANPSLGYGSAVGVELLNADNCTVRNNRIGDSTIGVLIKNSDGNTVRTNGIGRQIGDVDPFFASNGTGIVIENSNSNVVGGAGTTDGNTIGNSGAQGIWIKSGVSNPMLRNVFANNGGQDIDLGNAGSDLGDYYQYDADTGANTLLNAPLHSDVLFANDGMGGPESWANWGITVPNLSSTFRVDVYESSSVKGSGLRWLTSDTRSYGGPVPLGFPANHAGVYFPALPDGAYISATVTRIVNGVATDTSEFSSPVRIVGNPYIRGSAFKYETGHSVTYTFSRDVSTSLNANDLTVYNLANLAQITPSSYVYDATTNTVTFRFNQLLPDGNYRAVLNKAGVTSPVLYNTLAPATNMPAVGEANLDFHVLSGDANRDGAVNFSDLLIVAQNYGTTGKTFSQGNFNYSADGKVDFADLLIIAQRYGTSLFSAQPILAEKSVGGRQRNSDLLQ